MTSCPLPLYVKENTLLPLGLNDQRPDYDYVKESVFNLYALNDSPAAATLLEQLPLTVQVEDYSSNEKIFYPPQKLDISDSPAASGGSGTLAYYAPWGDIVMFYGDFDENPSLYELGRIVSGEELLSQLDGSITIEAA